MMTGLTLPVRPEKPRKTGRTHALDRGLGLMHVKDLLELSGPHLDLVKLGWGTSAITRQLAEKIALYQSFDVEVCLGGTLFELYYVQDKVDEYIANTLALGLKHVEISDGCVEIQPDEKLRLIEQCSQQFCVFSEVGSKDDKAIVSPAKWVRAIKRELEAGASYVILEGRESGTAGLYRGSGEIRMGLVDEIMEADIDVNRLIFETPARAQQVWVLTTVGLNTNLGNIAPDDVLPLETLRLGLRADTLKPIHAAHLK